MKQAYTSNWDLATIPDSEWRSEAGRRSGAKRKTKSGGRPKQPTACPRCGEVCAGYRVAMGHCAKGHNV